MQMTLMTQMPENPFPAEAAISSAIALLAFRAEVTHVLPREQVRRHHPDDRRTSMANKHLFPNDGTAVKSTKKSDSADKALASEAAEAHRPEYQHKQEPKEAAKKKRSSTKSPRENRPSMVAAALQVLTFAKEPMSWHDLVEAMATKGSWTSPGGKTPANTLYSAFLRLIKTKGKVATVRKAGKGKFEINPPGTA